MKKYTYHILFVSLLLLIWGIFGYRYWKKNYAANSWELVPASAVLVLESTNPLTLWKEWQKTTQSGIHTLPDIHTLLTNVYSLAEYDGDIQEFFSDKQILTSLHVTTRNNFDYVFYLPIKSDKEQQTITELIEEYRNSPRSKIRTRTFQEHQITEVSLPSARLTFSFFFHHNHLIGSYTPFLIEDVIRNIDQSVALQKNTWSKIKESYPAPTGSLQVYVQASALPRLFHVFTDEPFNPSLSLLQEYAQSSSLVYKANDQEIRLDGLSMLSQKEKALHFLSVFKNQQPQPLSCLNLIPNHTAALLHWGFHDPKKLAFSLQNYWAANDAQTVKAQEKLRTHYHISPSAFTQWMGNEIALAFLENTHYTPEKLLFIQAQDIALAQQSVGKITSTINAADETTPYAESFAGIPIREIALPDFPAAMLGPSFSGFSQCFYAPVENYIVFAESVQSLKKLLHEIESDNVWATSAKKKNLLKKAAANDNVGIFMASARIWPLLHSYATPAWKKSMQTYASGLKNIAYVSLQMRYEEEEAFQTNILLQLEEKLPAGQEQNKFLVNATSTIDHSLQTPPYIVRNHADKSREILAQDINNQLYLIDKSGKKLWKKPLPATIVSDIRQIDYFANNKLQYLFATPSAIYAIDRKGNMVSGFPVRLPDTVRIHTLATLDYDNSHDYRFLASDRKGDLYLYSKEGKLLDGWNPLRLPYGYGLSSAASHIRIQGKDYILVPQANGIIHVLNRKGKSYEGFPFLINDRIHNPVFIEAGVNTQKTSISVLTDNGEITTFNLMGEILSQRQLYRPDKSTVFKAIIETSGKDWLVARQDNEKLSILDKEGKTLFEKEYSSPRHTFVQLYDFGAGLRIIAITDLAQKQTFLYDYNGRLLTDQAIKNSQLISILYQENQDRLVIYRSDGHELGTVTIRL
ncbi:DUF3352 domain-containing protein [Rhodocytophaga aerolata]|uniref:DUF3352 domain-containing protein n=1 Tax=Rhodocytophaga aerolata TaxID=455078 RepID=A0ABT8R6Q9_9BACT|nr:DUF3352 domain-containing protein [Rhodocytophaga aerolata]MDO1447786.1 DUF3352 domain-containing protein [Rhodocytophaga aerolata]